MVMINRICDYIIRIVQENSILSGFQYEVDYKTVEDEFGIIVDEEMKQIISANLSQREEVADVVLDEDGFNVVIYTKYAPNYNKEYFETME
jgi:Fe-S cluster assembly iron-binding protein IscA